MSGVIKSMHNIKINRNELKYYIPYKEYIVLSNLLKKIFQKDKYHKESLGGYLVRSLYFDTIDNKSFEDKVGGIEERSKYRLRIYDTHSKSVKFEIKSKTNYIITKETAIISRNDAEEIQKTNYEVMLKYNNEVLNKVYIEFKKRSYYPVVLVEYLRVAFLYDANKIRVVFDRFLKSTPLQLDLFTDTVFMPQLKKDIVIMEIKYDNFIPMWIKQLLQVPSFERSAISKYVIGRLDTFGTLI
ncbi:MAG: polyphosphate polymerase domain-containing protein [Nanoarchaeota archaeon]|nr:polyphosphate polymerase domain-containing protein [Nanoarchaeota archaeon]